MKMVLNTMTHSFHNDYDVFFYDTNLLVFSLILKASEWLKTQ